MPALKQLIDAQTDPELLESLFRNVSLLNFMSPTIPDHTTHSCGKDQIWPEVIMQATSNMWSSLGSMTCSDLLSPASGPTGRMNVVLTVTTRVGSSVLRNGTGMMRSKLNCLAYSSDSNPHSQCMHHDLQGSS